METDFFDALGFGPSGYGGQFLEGMLTTLVVAVASALCALIWGSLLGAMSCSKWVLPRLVWRVYRSIFASMPTLLVLFFLYFGTPYLASSLTGVSMEIGPFTAGLCALGAIYASYVGEVVRGAILAVPRGQYEACAALGLGPLPTWLRVVIPQIVKVAFPGLVNNWVVLLKDTALVSVVGLADVVRVGQIAGSATNRPLLFLTVVGLFYVVIVTASLGLLRAARPRAASR
ncbi:MAG: ABC transporter permease subunit [Parvibaculaceae bacterium]